MAFVRWLQAVDRRVVYLLLVAVLATAFVVPYSLPIHPDTYTRQYFDEIERIAADSVASQKVVLVLANWGPGTFGENDPQFQGVMRHLLRRHLRFVMICSMGDPSCHDAAALALERAKESEVERARRRGAPVPSWVYGEDYLDFGYRNAPIFAPQAKSIIADAREFFRQDYRNKRDLTDDASYPLLRRYHGLHDVSAVLVISPDNEAKYIAGLIKGEYPDLEIGPATAGIVASDLYPYVKSGQLFGMLNSARAAAEYRTLLNPDEPSTNATDNALSFGKALLLLLVLLGNVAYLTVQRAERTGRLSPVDPRHLRPPLPPLPRTLMWSIFAAFVALYGSATAIECCRFARDGALPRTRVAMSEDDLRGQDSKFERVGRAELLAEARASAAGTHNPLLTNVVEREARARYARLIEARVGEFLMAFLTLGVLAFLLGDNRFYRFIEALIVGGALAYMLDQVDKILRPDWFEPVVHGFTGAAHWSNVLWLLLLVPVGLWYFTYSKKYRWFNQLLVALFIGLMIGPEFKNQVNLILPQILDTIRPIWPWAADAQPGAVRFQPARLEHLVFVAVAVLSLTYFIFIFRPRTRVGRGTLIAGRLAMMVGFGAMFGNTVNTRLSWLAPRIGFLIDDWLGKLWAP